MKNPTCPAHLFQSVTGYATELLDLEISTERLVSHEKSRLALCDDLIQARAEARPTFFEYFKRIQAGHSNFNLMQFISFTDP